MTDTPDLELVAASVIERAIGDAYDITVGFHASVNDRAGMPAMRLATRIVEAMGRNGILPSPTPAPLDVIYESLVFALGQVPSRSIKNIHEVSEREAITGALLRHLAMNGLRVMRVEPFHWNNHFLPHGQPRFNSGTRADSN
jgi:hypothetical protein